MSARYAHLGPSAMQEAVKIQKIENKRVRFLSPEEAGDLLAYLKRGNRTIHDMAFLSLFTGYEIRGSKVPEVGGG